MTDAPEAAGCPGVSLAIPLRDEEESVDALIAEIGAAGLAERWEFEAIVVDDGSQDGSLERLRGQMARHPFLRVLALDGRRGKTAAWDAGFSQARGEFIVTMDADLQNDPRDIPRLIEVLNAGHDLVSGQRRRRADTLWRRVQSRVANRVRQALLGDGVQDVGCGLKAFRRSCLERVHLFDGAHRFMEALFQMHGFRVAEVPVADRARRFGRPKYGLRNRLIRPLADTLGVRWLQRRTITGTFRIIDPPGPEG